MKICGITSEADARLLIKYGADYGGMVVFYPKSKRDITIDEAGKLAKMLKESDIKTVAVTVSPDTDKLRQIQDNGFDYIQIHGELYEDVYNESRIPIIRAVNIGKNDNMDDIKKAFQRQHIRIRLLVYFLMRVFQDRVKHLTGMA